MGRTWIRWKTSTRWLKTLYLWFKTLFLWLKTHPLLSRIIKKTLFYGIYGNGSKNHNTRITQGEPDSGSAQNGRRSSEMWSPWNMHRSNDWAAEGLRGRRQEVRLLSMILERLLMPTRVLSSQSRREGYNCYLTDSCYVCVTWWPLGGPRLAPNLGLNELRLMPTHFRCLTRRN